MQQSAATVDEYLAGLPEDRRAALSAVRKVMLDNLPEGLEEGMQYGMIGYFVPHSRYPAGYHCNPKQPLPYAGMASQKHVMTLYFCTIYGESEVRDWFVAAYRATGKKLDMGKGCIRFKKLEDLPLDVVAELLRRTPLDRFLAVYEAGLQTAAAQRKARR